MQEGSAFHIIIPNIFFNITWKIKQGNNVTIFTIKVQSNILFRHFFVFVCDVNKKKKWLGEII